MAMDSTTEPDSGDASGARATMRQAPIAGDAAAIAPRPVAVGPSTERALQWLSSATLAWTGEPRSARWLCTAR